LTGEKVKYLKRDNEDGERNNFILEKWNNRVEKGER